VHRFSLKSITALLRRRVAETSSRANNVSSRANNVSSRANNVFAHTSFFDRGCKVDAGFFKPYTPVNPFVQGRCVAFGVQGAMFFCSSGFPNPEKILTESLGALTVFSYLCHRRA